MTDRKREKIGMSAKDRSKSDLSVHAISVSTCNLNNIIVYESNDEARIRSHVYCAIWRFNPQIMLMH